MINLDDTIAALSTSPGAAGIAVVKISGPDAYVVARRIFQPSSPQDRWPHRRMIHGHVIGAEGEVIDEALAVYLPAPHSYTRQDVVEIQTHGGMAAPSTLLDLLADRGVRMAQAGEFTRRAFLLGRIDLVQAEAVLDVISARTRAGLVAAGRQLFGALSGRIDTLRERLIEARALLEANIDFPDEEIGRLDRRAVASILDSVDADLKRLLATYAAGRLYREGVFCVIAGRPNVGKSSLLNRLVRRQRAIVTPTPGTTRDAIEATANIGGVPFRLMDTAGLHEPSDPIEGEGVRIARELIEQADLVLVLCDASLGVLAADRDLLEELADRRTLPVVNKIDLVDEKTASDATKRFGGDAIPISATTGQGEQALRDAMLAAVHQGGALPSDEAILTNARHRQAIIRGQQALGAGRAALDENLSPELIALDLVDAHDALGEVVGKGTPDDVLDLIFSRFCIGK